MTYNEAIEWMDSRHWSGTGKGIRAVTGAFGTAWKSAGQAEICTCGGYERQRFGLRVACRKF